MPGCLLHSLENATQYKPLCGVHAVDPHTHGTELTLTPRSLAHDIDSKVQMHWYADVHAVVVYTFSLNDAYDENDDRQMHPGGRSVLSSLVISLSYLAIMSRFASAVFLHVAFTVSTVQAADAHDPEVTTLNTCNVELVTHLDSCS